MTQMQVAIGLRWKTGHNLAVFLRSKVIAYDRTDKVIFFTIGCCIVGFCIFVGRRRHLVAPYLLQKW